MATYTEIATIRQQAGWGAFQEKVVVAVTVKATALLNLATPSQAQRDWAEAALSSPINTGNSLIWYVVAANKSASVAAILGATDNAVQSNVDVAADAIIG